MTLCAHNNLPNSMRDRSKNVLWICSMDLFNGFVQWILTKSFCFILVPLENILWKSSMDSHKIILFYPGSASTRNTSGSLSDFLLARARENHFDFPRNASHIRAR